MTETPPHPFIHPCAPAELEGRTCFACGQAYEGAKEIDGGLLESRRFVELRVQPNGADPVVPPGMTITEKHEAGRKVIAHRDPWSSSGTQTTTTQLYPVLCTDCIAAAAIQGGLPPATEVLQNQAAEDRDRAEHAETELAEIRAEWEAAKQGYQAVRAVQALLDVERADKPTTKRKAAAA